MQQYLWDSLVKKAAILYPLLERHLDHGFYAHPAHQTRPSVLSDAIRRAHMGNLHVYPCCVIVVRYMVIGSGVSDVAGGCSTIDKSKQL